MQVPGRVKGVMKLMNHTFHLLSFGIFVAFLGATSLQAAPANCAAHTDVTARLAEIYGERRQAMGVANGNTILEIFASDNSGSWSITVTKPGEETCLVAAGQGFRVEAAPPVAEDPDA